MMELKLRDSEPAPVQSFGGNVQLHNLTWWFWIKAGMGFTVGVGCIYLVWAVVWIYLLSKIPMLYFARLLTRY